MSELLDHQAYKRALAELRVRLVRFQGFVKQTRARVLIIVEGRDASGKGGAIKRFTEPLNPRGCRVVALDRASERERTQWYFQRYLQHLPDAGEIVVFDRSWYNRAGLEKVMGFCTDAEYEAFMAAAPTLEGLLVQGGIALRKIYFDISKPEQARRLDKRASNPLLQWKLSVLDREAQARFEDYTRAADAMFERTSTPQAPWVILPADDKRSARLAFIRAVLDSFPT